MGMGMGKGMCVAFVILCHVCAALIATATATETAKQHQEQQLQMDDFFVLSARPAAAKQPRIRSSAPPRPLQLQVRHSSSFSLFHRFGLAISSSCRCHGALEQIALVTIGRMDMPFALFGPTDRMPLLVRDQAHSSRWI